MNLPPLPKLPMQFDHIHTLESTGDVEDVPVYTENQLRTYAEQYGRLCAEASAAELDRLQARVAELEVDAERLTDDGAEDIRALADRLLGRTASFPDMRQAALLLQDMYLEHRTAARKAKP